MVPGRREPAGITRDADFVYWQKVVPITFVRKGIEK